MPPITASSVSFATSRLVTSARLSTLTGRLVDCRAEATATGSSLFLGLAFKHFAAGKERRKNQRHRRLGRYRLLDRAIDDNAGRIPVGERMVRDGERIQYRPHRARHQRLPD